MTAAQLEHLSAGVARAGLDVGAIDLPVERDIIANGIQLHLVEWGSDRAGAGAPLIFLHGGSLTARTWDLVCLALSDRHRCVAVDMRGYGKSEWPTDGDYRHASMAADAAGVITELDLRRPVVVGMSMGGLAALRLAGERWASLGGLVVVDIGPDLCVAAAREIMAFHTGRPGARHRRRLRRPGHDVQPAPHPGRAPPEPAVQPAPAAEWPLDVEVGHAPPP